MRPSVAPINPFTLFWTGATIPLFTGPMISVTTDRGRLTPEQTPTTDSEAAVCAETGCGNRPIPKRHATEQVVMKPALNGRMCAVFLSVRGNISNPHISLWRRTMAAIV